MGQRDGGKEMEVVEEEEASPLLEGGTWVEFRTPQNPRLGTNYWGGPSPLLARNIPEESLEHKYFNLNHIRTRDEIFPTHDPILDQIDYAPTSTPKKRGFFRKLFFFRNKRPLITISLGSKKRRLWRLPTMDYRNRWPNGWC